VQGARVQAPDQEARTIATRDDHEPSHVKHGGFKVSANVVEAVHRSRRRQGQTALRLLEVAVRNRRFGRESGRPGEGRPRRSYAQAMCSESAPGSRSRHGRRFDRRGDLDRTELELRILPTGSSAGLVSMFAAAS